jgi:UDP:flavonoid glycosyltransferase YjiC (YdhE family)
MGSMLEAVYYKVPIIGIGIFGDQVRYCFVSIT